MAITNADGFETYDNVQQMLQHLWIQLGAGNAGTGLSLRGDAATGAQCLRVSSLNYRLRGSLGGVFSKAGVSFHIRPLQIAEYPNSGHFFMSFNSLAKGATERYFGVEMNPAGRLTLRSKGQDSPILGVTDVPLPARAWSHLEVLAGRVPDTVEIYVNGKLALSAVTAIPDDLYAFAMGSELYARPGVDFEIDDLVTQGGNNPGDVVQQGILGAYHLPPDEDLLPQGWALTSGTEAWRLINEIKSDGDVSYIFADGIGDKSAFGTTELPSDIRHIAAVIPMARARKSDTGDAWIKVGVRFDTVEVQGPSISVPSNYYYFTTVVEKNPVTNANWTPDNLPAITVERTT